MAHRAKQNEGITTVLNAHRTEPVERITNGPYGSQMNQREEHTQCLHGKKDGTRCQLDTAPGDFACRHHTIAVNDFIEDPMAVIAKFRQYFPKNHHPACDRERTERL